MANDFVNLPAPAADGSGAEVDVSALGADKTIVCKIPSQSGVPAAQVLIEYSNDNAFQIWTPLVQFTKPGIKSVQIAARYLRATVVNYTGAGAPTVDVGASEATVTFAELVPTAGNGQGSAVDVSALPGFKTIQVVGTFKGVANIEASCDGGTTYATVASFQQKGGTWSGIVYADRMRISRSGILAREANPGTFTCDIGAVDLAGGGGGLESVATDVSLYGDGTEEDPLTRRANRVFRLYDDFCNLKETTSIVTGTGTVQLATASNYGLGVMRLRTPAEGDDAAGNLNDSIPNIRTSGQVFDGYVEFSIASDGIPPGAGDDYIFRCGLSDEPDGAAGNIGNGWMFALSLAKFGVATWCLVKDDVTFDTTAQTNDGLPHVFRIEFGRAVDTTCYMRGYIDGVLVAEIDPGVNWTPVVLAVASLQNVGQSEGLNFFIDYIDVCIRFDDRP